MILFVEHSGKGKATDAVKKKMFMGREIKKVMHRRDLGYEILPCDTIMADTWHHAFPSSYNFISQRVNINMCKLTTTTKITQEIKGFQKRKQTIAIKYSYITNV